VRGLLVGRFQPFHKGHLAVVEALRRERPQEELLLGIGSAQLSYTPENPFTASERMEMVLRALAEAGLSGVLPIPLLDIDRHGEWVNYLATLLPPFERVYTTNPLTRLLFETGGYTVVEVPWRNREAWEGTRIRRLLATGGPWQPEVPPAVAEYLDGIGAAARLQLLAVAPRPPTVHLRP
jgi:nicotinamide-nucleotide adenylyltransferase